MLYPHVLFSTAAARWQDGEAPPAGEGQLESPPPTEGGDSGDTPPGSEAGDASITDAGLDNAPEGTVTDALNEAASQLMDSLGTTFEQTTLLGWGMLFAGILGGLIAGRIVRAILDEIASRLEKRDWTFRGAVFRSGARPASLSLFNAGLAFGITWIHLEGELTSFVLRIIAFLYIIAIGWFIYNLVDLVDIALRRLTAKTASKLDDMIAPLIRKALRIFVVVIFVLFVAENVFGADITAWLAGLGIAGLAVSLSAQDSIKNLFGSITILLDKPFAVGDRIIFNGTDGFIEEIGFRSTRIRTFGGHVVTIPNMKFIDSAVENVSRRPYIRRVMEVTITYDTPPEKIEQGVEILKGIMNDTEVAKPFNMEQNPPRIHFTAMNADNLAIQCVYWYMLDNAKGQDWWAYLAHGEMVNLRIFREFADAGIDFAFPTQTLYLAGDPARQLSVRLLREGAETE